MWSVSRPKNGHKQQLADIAAKAGASTPTDTDDRSHARVVSIAGVAGRRRRFD